MRKTNIILLLAGIISICAMTVADKPTPLTFSIPKGWPKPARDIFANNKLTEEGFQLGRKLFYDGNLSKDGQVSCASCHQQFSSFANYDHDFSHGVNNSFSRRNAPALINVAWMEKMHWNGAINHIEMQPLAPLTNPDEMGETLESVIDKLKKDSSYAPMFSRAFGSTDINSQRMLKALSQYVGSLVSANSKYDKVMRGETSFSATESNGYRLFRSHCATCHREPLFTDNSFRNNGQQINKKNDIGLQETTGLKTDSLKFKVPTLRNVQLTLPYMHDGHIYSLYKVIDHYIKDLDTSSTLLDPLLKKKINMTEREKYELVYFLYTLTDSSFVRNPRFGPPSNGK